MSSLRRFGRQHPQLTALFVLMLSALAFSLPILIYGAVNLSGPSGLIPVEYLVSAIGPQIVMVSVIVATVAVLDWWRACHLTTPVDRKGPRTALWITLVPLSFFTAIATTILIEGEGSGHFRTLELIVILNAFVGLFEEILFRGIVFHGLRARHGVARAIIGSSLLFGAFHLTNLGVGQGAAITLFQVVNATAIGIFLCAIVLQTNSLWPAIWLHAIWNSYAMSGQLLISTVDMPDVEATLTVTARNYILPALIALAGWYLYHRWHRRVGASAPGGSVS